MVQPNVKILIHFLSLNQVLCRPSAAGPRLDRRAGIQFGWVHFWGFSTVEKKITLMIQSGLRKFVAAHTKLPHHSFPTLFRFLTFTKNFLVAAIQSSQFLDFSQTGFPDPLYTLLIGQKISRPCISHQFLDFFRIFCQILCFIQS